MKSNSSMVNRKECIRIKDNGPGVSPFQMKETLTSFGMTQNMRNSMSHSSPFSISEHGIGLKLSLLRLGDTCVIITKTNPKDQIGVQYLTIGLISVDMHRDISEEHLLIPIICYQIINNETFIPLTPDTNNVFSLMKKYIQPLFSSESDIQRYSLNNMGHQGTHIFITDLKSNQETGDKEINLTNGDIVRNYNAGGPNQVIMSQPYLYENSLTSFAQWMFLKRPNFLRLSINGSNV